MAVQEQVGVNISTASGSTGTFPYSFRIMRLEDLLVTVNGVVVNGLGAYSITVTGIGEDAGGNVQLTPFPPAGATVVRASIPKMDRQTNYQYAGDIKSTALNADFDRLWLAIQAVNRRSLLLPASENYKNLLPAEAAARARKALIFDDQGRPTISPDDYLDTAENARLAALARAVCEAAAISTTNNAAAAASSASSAASSASSAAASATTATSAASTATTKASEASTSASQAATSATSASSSATSALNSKNAAATSETNAAGSATSAASSASGASTSATNAASSASAASTSASSASASQSAAASSATSAASSASSASSSATTASNAASTATTKATEAASSASDALASKNAAATSESNAATSATSASNSATSASSSATAAASSASSASDSASSALTSKNAAATSETNAASSASAAATSASSASTSASNAATSESNALTSKNAAAASASAAATSETNAASSASSASSSATSAASSASTATTKASEASTSAANAASSASAALTSEQNADASEASALQAKVDAELARDAAFGAAKIFQNTTDGLANTSGTGATNRYFSTPVNTTSAFLSLWRNDSGVATFIVNYPSKAALDELRGFFVKGLPAGYQFAITDDFGNAVFVILDDGTIQVADLFGASIGTQNARFDELEVATYAFSIIDLNGARAFSILADGTVKIPIGIIGALAGDEANFTTVIASLLQLTTQLDLGPNRFDNTPRANYAWEIVDAAGDRCMGIKSDGTVDIIVANFQDFVSNKATIRDLTVDKLTVGGSTTVGGSGGTAAPATAKLYDADINHVIVYGHSGTVGYQSVPPISTTQPYDSLRFNGGARPQDQGGGNSQAAAHASLQPLVESQVSGGNTAGTALVPHGETWCSGLANYAKALIAQEDAKNFNTELYQFLLSAPGESGANMLQLKKGDASGYYARFLDDITYGRSLALGANKTYMVQMIAIQMGENDEKDRSGSIAQFESDWLAIRADMKADIAAMPQSKAPIFSVVQSASHLAHNGDAQKRATWAYTIEKIVNDHADVYLACPNYIFNRYSDNLHYTAEGSKWVGAYHALVYKKVVIDKTGWKHLAPVEYTRQGSVIEIRLDVPYRPLKVDTTIVAANTNHGFEVLDGSGAQVTISSVSIIRDDTIKIVCAVPVLAGYKVRYAYTDGGANNDAGPITGARGNIRDSMGDTYVAFPDDINKRLDNWLILFEKTLT